MGTLLETSPSVGVDQRGRRSQRPVLTRGWLLAVAAVSGVTFLGVRRSLIDDSYITLGYARNLAEHFHWGLVAAETANSATSPLNVMLLALGGTVTRIAGGSVHPVAGLGLVFIGCMVLVGWGFLRIARALRLPFVAAVVGTLLVLLNPFVLSATGLEVHLTSAMLVLLTAFALEGRPVWFGGVAGLALLARLDLVIFVVLLALGTRTLRRRFVPLLLTALAVCLPWFVFSWLVLGSAIPDTFVIKTVQGAFGEYTYGNGPWYYLDEKRRTATVASFAPAVAGLVALPGLLAWRVKGGERAARFGPVALVGFGALVFYGAYSLIGVPPYQWYFVTPIVSLSIVLTVALFATPARLGPRFVAVALACAAVLPLGYVDLSRHLPWESPPIFGNWATATDYARVGREIGRRVGNATVLAPPEIGTLAFFCECTMVDQFADQGRVMPIVETKIQASGPVMAALLRFNYRWLDWGREPRPIDYRLRWTPTPISGPDTWHLWSPATGDGYVVLEPVRPPS